MSDRPRVLIADDDPSVVSLLKVALERDGFEAVVARDGLETIDRLNEGGIAVVLLDVHMPVIDGLEALRRIRADDEMRTLPVILITGEDSVSHRVLGLESGADDYLVKPFALEEVAARVRTQIRARSAWEQEVDRGREHRRRLAVIVEELPRGAGLTTMATDLVDRLPHALDLDGATILLFGHRAVRTIASSGVLRAAYPPTQTLTRAAGKDVSTRSSSGAWLAAYRGTSESTTAPVDLAYVPFRLGPTPMPVGCLVFGLGPDARNGRLSHRLPDLIDATEFIVAVLRPAVELAENEDVAVTQIQRIVSRREFEVHLQPIVRLDTGAIVAQEALTRFADGTRPEIRFADAARLGLDTLLQRATLAAALQVAAATPSEVALTVNLSADVVRRDASLPRLVAGASRPLIIEITEHERIDDYDAVRAALRRLGPHVKLAIDDAGSGYASLRHILALRPDYVKLDIEWVRGIDRDPVRRALVSGLVHFADETGSELIAEGIETDAELQAVRELGIHLGQGYLLGRPAAVGRRDIR